MQSVRDLKPREECFGGGFCVQDRDSASGADLLGFAFLEHAGEDRDAFHVVKNFQSITDASHGCDDEFRISRTSSC